MAKDFFPQRPAWQPMIYAYSEKNPNYAGLLKVGFTGIGVDERVAQQFPVLQPGERPYEIVFREPAVRADGTCFTDYDVHEQMKRSGIPAERTSEGKETEYFRCTERDVRAAYNAVMTYKTGIQKRDMAFPMRPEQRAAVLKTSAYFESVEREGGIRTPKFLWNAKMRFGKTFAAYQLAKHMNMRRVLILTFKPSAMNAWEEDLNRHVDFEGWQFVTREGELSYEDCDPKRPIVCFGSFQDFLGRNKETGGIKAKNEWVHLEDWDLVIFDEYHFGAWNENSKSLFEKEADEDELNTGDEADTSLGKANTGNEIDETWLPISTRFYLYLSGTPFRALNSGELIEEQIFNWTYSDEQRAKEEWPKDHPNEPNPYAMMPRMVLMTYKMPEEIRRIAMGGEFNTFDLNAFFSAEGEGDAARFKYKEYVQSWLDLMRGAYKQTVVDGLKVDAKRSYMPFNDTRLTSVLNHTVWYLPRVNSCYAMRNLLREPQNLYYHDFEINCCAGTAAGNGVAALDNVRPSMKDPLKSRSITLTCGKLLTGVTVRPWTGIFMLSNISSPESYFQAAFRVQSPWTVKDEDGRTVDMKPECYVFDFALDRSLRMVSDYSCRLSLSEDGPEQKVQEFIDFLPVLAYDGGQMSNVDAGDILDIAMAGTSATLLARRWESALLVNVDNDTLRRILANDRAVAALMKIEGFRSMNNLSNELETIIAKSESVKKTKREKTELTPKEKKELTEEEKEFKTKRRQIQEKLMKFATRIPLFMYLTDYREETLKDVITQLEPGLFKKVTGLEVEDFELLVSLGVFDDGMMNDAVYKFRRYEDSSLSYTGINRHEGEKRGMFDTTLSEYEYMELARQESMVTPEGLSVTAPEDAPKPKPALRPEKDKTRKEPIANKILYASSKPPYEPKPVVEEEVVLPPYTVEELAEVAEGDLVFSKAFGYGTVIFVSDQKINVAFDDDKKDHRTFQMPVAFLNGWLTWER